MSTSRQSARWLLAGRRLSPRTWGEACLAGAEEAAARCHPRPPRAAGRARDPPPAPAGTCSRQPHQLRRSPGPRGAGLAAAAARRRGPTPRRLGHEHQQLPPLLLPSILDTTTYVMKAVVAVEGDE
eukprot:1883066-Pyramimonas_sp.AAC.1